MTQVTKDSTITISNYIDGEWTEGYAGETLRNTNPATGELVCYIQKSTEKEVHQAVNAANASQSVWRSLTGAERGQYLYRIASEIEKRHAEIAEIMVREMGKTFPECKGEVQRAIDIFRYYAGEGVRKIGDVIPSTANGALMYTTRVPIGVVAVITPWNFPIAIPAWKMAPALIYGNTVVFKPAQEAPYTATKLVECFEAAGLPDGVVNLVHGEGRVVGDELSKHPSVNGITFTGSNTVGKQIGGNAFAGGKKFQLEMGGKNPLIVMEDADLDLAVQAALSGAMKSTGQKCTATSRVIVQASVYDVFKEKLLEEVEGLKVGDGMKEDSWLGPCASERQMENVLSYIRKGVEEGGRLIHGGSRLTDGELANGYYVEPTVFENVTSSMTIAQEEIFGPVIALMKADSLDDCLLIANDVSFGLSASIFTKDIGKILSFIEKIDVGLVRVNSETAGVEYQVPFGGMKESSSHSREQGQAAVEFYTSIKTVYIQQ